MRVRSLTRLELPLGEAIRLELESEVPADADERHLQYYVVTEAGPWALWLSCTSEELADREEVIQRLQYKLVDEP
jgi:hypothetical protein